MDMSHPTAASAPTFVAVQFPGNKGRIEFNLYRLSRAAPPTTLLGGYRIGDEVFYAGVYEEWSNGDRLVYGAKGEVVGPATSEAVKGKGVNGINCFLTNLSRSEPPPLPGGYSVGDEVFWTGESKTFLRGSRLLYGGKVEVVGPATSEAAKGKGVKVRFTEHSSIDCFLTNLSRAAPPTTLLGGYRVGDEVFYTGASATFPDGINRLVRTRAPQ